LSGRFCEKLLQLCGCVKRIGKGRVGAGENTPMSRFAGLPQRLRMVALALALALLGPRAAALTDAEPGVTTSYGYAVFGELKYGPGFEHFDYVDPEAPKGGTYRYASQGVSFDSLNQIALLGTIPPSLMFMTDTLIKQSRDEPASYYCLVCKTMTWPADLSWAEFELDPRARFDDGTPVTP
jgi:microcin C transport system substrate-binding protein